MMAGSRLEKVGTVFSRVRDLMRAGVIKESQKPVWFDVYSAFPPKREPVYVKPARFLRPKTEENVPEIFYKEDQIRAKFYELYGNGPKVFDLTKTSFVSTCQRFVEKYSELESRGDVDAKPEMLLDETAKALLADGVVLRRRGGGAAVAAETHNPVLSMKLTDMLAEQQKDTTSATHTPEEHTHTHTAPTDSSNTL
ncbi:28S ribosomal protein S23, mitochondrial [Tachysurus fulvidraco]|uniref:28S ribosomal protein S23, mitochondrial n=1 Tax=Tachysurus fulvidraco TaxID=1234273 RepID=UPI001FEDD99B|nr:28S ribosomal protein S23, mitochondrial [Tachysurus fulvidraco]XP_047676970.1 28S ribosomal protein S23, mitochondrial [Tachysurus fulvidraco]